MDNVTELARNVFLRKQDLEQAKSLLLIAEQELVKALAFDRPEGSKTFKLHGSGPSWDGAGSFKVTCKAGMNYTLDRDAWNQVEHLIQDGLRPVRTKLEADPTGCKWLRDNEPETWAICARAITVKPAKVSVSVERVSESEAA